MALTGNRRNDAGNGYGNAGNGRGGSRRSGLVKDPPSRYTSLPPWDRECDQTLV